MDKLYELIKADVLTKGKCSLSYKDFARILNVEYTLISSWIRILSNEGKIVKTQTKRPNGSQGRNVYTLGN